MITDFFTAAAVGTEGKIKNRSEGWSSQGTLHLKKSTCNMGCSVSVTGSEGDTPSSQLGST